MWGSDYPHEEGTHPFTREHLRQVMGDLAPEQIQQILAGNAAKLYGFDLEALRPAADSSARPSPRSRAADRAARRPNQALLRSAKQLAAAS